MRLEGKTAIISGAAGSLGACQAELFAREGARVVVGDVWDEGGHAVVESILAAGGEARYVHLDVTNPDAWEHAVQAALAAYGELDILVNNAGVSATSERDPMSIDGWHRIMNVNATGMFLGTAAAIPAMLDSGGGSIVNISSIVGIVGSAGGHPAYNASKGAVRAFTKAIAVTYGPRGIRCNSVHPGWMPPMRTGGPGAAEAREAAARVTPLRRIGEPIDIANGVLYLASDEAAFVTGAELVIDGGFIAQ